MGAIDVWAQITTARMADRPWLATLLRWTGREGDWLPTVESTLQAMNAAGVDISLLSAWHGPEGSLISNQEVSGQIDQAPARFRGLATVDLYRPMDAVREIKRSETGRPIPYLEDV